MLYFEDKTTVQVYDENSFRGTRPFSHHDDRLLTDEEKEERTALLEKQRMHRLIAEDSRISIQRRKEEEAVERYPFLKNNLILQRCVARGEPRSERYPTDWLKAMSDSENIPSEVADEAREWLVADYRGIYLSEIYDIVDYLLEKAGFEPTSSVQDS